MFFEMLLFREGAKHMEESVAWEYMGCFLVVFF